MARDREAARERARLRKLKKQGHAPETVSRKEKKRSVEDFVKTLHPKLPKFLDTMDAEYEEHYSGWQEWRKTDLDDFLETFLTVLSAGLSRVLP